MALEWNGPKFAPELTNKRVNDNDREEKETKDVNKFPSVKNKRTRWDGIRRKHGTHRRV